MKKALALILLCSGLAYAGPRPWKEGLVKNITSNSQDRGAVVVPIGGGLYGGHVIVTTVWYQVDTDDMIYMLAWVNKKHPLNLTLHGKTKIAMDSNGHDAHILDDSGKDIKLPIAQKVARPPETDPGK
jgi:hypothetical protein